MMTPTMKKYYLIMERPPGSNIWTFAYLAMDLKRAENMAIEISKNRKTCTQILTALLPKEKDTFCYAMMADNDTTCIQADQ
jgi:hypothetical protein